MILGILITAGVFVLSTAIVLWLCYRAPIIEDCDCEACQARRRRSRSSPPAPMKSDRGSQGTPRSRDSSPHRKSPRKARMIAVDHRTGGSILGLSEHAGRST